MPEHEHVWVLMDERITQTKRFGRPGERGFHEVPTERRRRFYCSGCRETTEDVEQRRWQEPEWSAA